MVYKTIHLTPQLPQTSLTSSPATHPLTYSAPVTLASWLFLNLLVVLLPQSLCACYSLILNALPQDVCMAHYLTSFKSLLKCQPSHKALTDHPLKNFALSFPPSQLYYSL